MALGSVLPWIPNLASPFDSWQTGWPGGTPGACARCASGGPGNPAAPLSALSGGPQSQQILALLAYLLSDLVANTQPQQQQGQQQQTGGSPPVGGAASGGGTQGGNSSSGSQGSGESASGQLAERQGEKLDSSIADNFDAMVAAAKKDGVDLQIESGWRSRQEQEVLYQKYLNGTGNLAAKPGTSNHESGQAIDFKNTPGAFEWLEANAARFGLKNLPGEPWHYSVNGK